MWSYKAFALSILPAYLPCSVFIYLGGMFSHAPLASALLLPNSLQPPQPQTVLLGDTNFHPEHLGDPPSSGTWPGKGAYKEAVSPSPISSTFEKCLHNYGCLVAKWCYFCFVFLEPFFSKYRQCFFFSQSFSDPPKHFGDPK